MPLSALTFHRQFVRFDKQIQALSDGERFVSFAEGLPARWEDYKSEVRSEAIRRLKFKAWSRAEIGKGKILNRVIAAIEINEPEPSRLRNNLVNWPNRFGHQARSHRALLDAQASASNRRRFEQWFYDFFLGRSQDEAAFDGFVDLVGDGRYDLVAYLFFLRDSSRFMPIAPTTFDKAFELLGINLVTSHHRSWANYVEYNAALAEVQRALRDVAQVRDARLIDAHSFCWMLVRQELPDAQPEIVIPLPTTVPTATATSGKGAPEDEDQQFAEMDEQEFLARDAERRRLGKLAQDIALRSERRRLHKAGHPDPDGAVKAVWNEPGRGFDILSCELDGTPRRIEVKAARRAGQTLSFFVTRNEWKKSRSLSNYFFYLVLRASSARPIVLALASQQVPEESLAATNYLASLKVATPSA